MVGGDVIAHLEHHVGGYAVFKSMGLGKSLMFGLYDFDAVHFLGGSGRVDHVVVYKEFFGQFDFGHFSESSRVGKHSGESRNRGGLGADEIDLCVGGAAASLKIAVECAERYTRRIGGLSHSDAGAAGTFENSCAGGDYVGKGAVLSHHVKHLAGTGEIVRLTVGQTVFPLRISATFIMSSSEELVQEPMHTWSTLMGPIS